MDFERITHMPTSIHTRWASPENPLARPGMAGLLNNGRKGNPCFPLMPGQTFVLAEAENTSGMIRRIWMTLLDRRPVMLRSLRLDFYWDSMAQPAFSVPVGDFFGAALGRTAPYSSAFVSIPEGRSFNSFFPMPFRRGMKITLTNEGNEPQPLVYYDIDFTIGDEFTDDTLYFHAHFRRENPTQLQEDFAFLPTLQGRGRFLGVTAGVRVNTKEYGATWWGEGEVKVYLDGDKDLPTLSGTGTEDYIGTGFLLGQYATPFQGCPVADHERNEYGFYRYHVPDPIFFYENIRVTIQQIGFFELKNREALKRLGTEIFRAGGPGRIPFDPDDKLTFPPYLERTDDYSSCSYFLLDRPESGLPDIADVELRTADLYEGDPPEAPSGTVDEEMFAEFMKRYIEQQTRYTE